MAQERPQHVNQALEQARQTRLEAQGADARREVVLEQIADALIGIRWSLMGMAPTLASQMR